MKVSVIIPIYNIESFCSACIESVINQTYGDLEIILVDDGSTDNCPQICDNYSKLDKRIEVIHRENGGLSAARNSGIDIATGDYIYFVDGDDLVHPECIERLVDCVTKSSADVAICATNAFLNEKRIDYSIVGMGSDIYTGREMCRRLMYGMDSSDDVIAWNKLYKCELFENVRYPEGMVYEDTATTHKLLWVANKIVFLRDELAFYRSNRSGSITHSGNKKYRDSIRASRMRIKYFESIEKNEMFEGDSLPRELAAQGKYLLCNDYARFIHQRINPGDVPNLKIEQRELFVEIRKSSIPITKKALSFFATYIPFVWLFADSIKNFLNSLLFWKGEIFHFFVRVKENSQTARL